MTSRSDRVYRRLSLRERTSRDLPHDHLPRKSSAMIRVTVYPNHQHARQHAGERDRMSRQTIQIIGGRTFAERKSTHERNRRSMTVLRVIDLTPCVFNEPPAYFRAAICIPGAGPASSFPLRNVT